MNEVFRRVALLGLASSGRMRSNGEAGQLFRAANEGESWTGAYGELPSSDGGVHSNDGYVEILT